MFDYMSYSAEIERKMQWNPPCLLLPRARNALHELFTLSHSDLQGGSNPYFFTQTGAKMEHAKGLTRSEHPVVLKSCKSLNLWSRATCFWSDWATRFFRVVCRTPGKAQNSSRCLFQAVSWLAHDCRKTTISASCNAMEFNLLLTIIEVRIAYRERLTFRTEGGPDSSKVLQIAIRHCTVVVDLLSLLIVDWCKWRFTWHNTWFMDIKQVWTNSTLFEWNVWLRKIKLTLRN